MQGGTTAVGDNLTINPTASALLVGGSNISANTLTLNNVPQSSGTWGSTTSSAIYKTNTYFGATTGIVTVGTSTLQQVRGLDNEHRLE